MLCNIGHIHITVYSHYTNKPVVGIPHPLRNGRIFFEQIFTACILIREKMLEFYLMVLPALSMYLSIYDDVTSLSDGPPKKTRHRTAAITGN